jgi:hypothetical protein
VAGEAGQTGDKLPVEVPHVEDHCYYLERYDDDRSNSFLTNVLLFIDAGYGFAEPPFPPRRR